MSSRARRIVVTSAPVAEERKVWRSIVIDTPVKDCCVCGSATINWSRNRTSMTSLVRSTRASSAWKTSGPVDRVLHPAAPGSHHQTPSGLDGSIAMQSRGLTTPMSSGVAVTTYRPPEHDASNRPAAVIALLAVIFASVGTGADSRRRYRGPATLTSGEQPASTSD